jgi:hypothetical protein
LKNSVACGVLCEENYEISLLKDLVGIPEESCHLHLRDGVPKIRIGIQPGCNPVLLSSTNYPFTEKTNKPQTGILLM